LLPTCPSRQPNPDHCNFHREMVMLGLASATPFMAAVPHHIHLGSTQASCRQLRICATASFWGAVVVTNDGHKRRTSSSHAHAGSLQCGAQNGLVIFLNGRQVPFVWLLPSRLRGKDTGLVAYEGPRVHGYTMVMRPSEAVSLRAA
jgi:hypothetical protein